ncbi:ammonium transporter [uncultured Desulfosarcina sp.]|uniref:ammonium transporter n=1 Tax=uncultured Desulfosarcina sp. TaxID=218289 RepID=UPI0029C661F3|nr:ammonium transporter [uncultured Desulfosarcina sp.]
MNEAPLIDVFWIVFSASLVFLMQPGFMCLESGLTRSKNSINVAVKNLADFAFSVIGFWAVGYAIMFGFTQSGLFGGTGFFFSFDQGAFPTAFFFFQVMFCGTATTIFSGAVAERMKFSSYLVIAGLLAVCVYPVFGHWAWNGLETGEMTGWLGSRGFVDFAGSTVVHSVGDWLALAALLVIGPRDGRFPENGPPREMTAFNLPMSILGVMLLWFGWFGFNGGSTLALNGLVPGIIAKTTLAASTGAAACVLFAWYTTGLPKVTALINGSLGGLVAITACCHCVGSVAAAVIGVVAGLVCLLVEHLLVRFKVDDAVGAVPVHLGCGIWGTLAVALFGDAERLGTGLNGWGQFVIQAEGIVAAFVVAFVIPYFVIRRIDRIWPMRVSIEDEKKGLNVSEHGATTELHDLFEAMDYQTKSGDLSVRVPVEPFTEVGQIAEKYNHVMSALERASSTIETVFRSASDAIVTFAAGTHQILHVNPSAWRMFGFPGPAEMVGCPVTDLFVIPEEGGRQSVAARLFSYNHVELRGIRLEGPSFPVEGIVTAPGESDEGFFVGTFRDISKRKDDQAKIERQQAFFR